MTDHHLEYVAIPAKGRGSAGLQSVCSCGDFHAYVGGASLETELWILAVHAAHVDARLTP